MNRYSVFNFAVEASDEDLEERLAQICDLVGEAPEEEAEILRQEIRRRAAWRAEESDQEMIADEKRRLLTVLGVGPEPIKEDGQDHSVYLLSLCEWRAQHNTDALLAWCVSRGWSVAIDGPYPCWDVHIYASPGHHFVGKSLAWKQSYDLEGGAGTAFARAVIAAAEAAE